MSDRLPVRRNGEPLDRERRDVARELGMGYRRQSADEPLFDDTLPAVVEQGSMVIIQLGSRAMHRVHVTMDWLRSVLPEGPLGQVERASLVIATDPEARLCQIIKADVGSLEPDTLLEMHMAALG